MIQYRGKKSQVQGRGSDLCHSYRLIYALAQEMTINSSSKKAHGLPSSANSVLRLRNTRDHRTIEFVIIFCENLVILYCF